MNKKFLIVIFLLALIMAPFVFAQSDADDKEKDFTDSVSDAASAAKDNISEVGSKIADKAKEIGTDLGKGISNAYDNLTGNGATTVSMVAAVAIGAAALLA